MSFSNPTTLLDISEEAVDGKLDKLDITKESPPRKASATSALPSVHRSRPGFPHRIQVESSASSIDESTYSAVEKSDAEDIDFSHKIDDEEHGANSQDTDAIGITNETLDISFANAETQSNQIDPPNSIIQPMIPDDDDQETDGLLDKIDLDHSKTHENNSRRGSQSRVRSLSGNPLAIPHICSAAILRQGIGTALSAITYTDDENAGENPSASEVNGVQRQQPDVYSSCRRGSCDLRSDSYRVRKNVNWDPQLLIEGVLFRANYLGSTQLTCDGRPTKSSRMMQAEEAVSRIKAPAGENQPSTPVDLCISTEKIMVLNTGTQDAIMDPSLRSISYIADIGDLVVLMARRDESNNNASSTPSEQSSKPPTKIICHVFDSSDATIIAQSIGQAFQVAYAEFLRANGLTDDSTIRQVDYQQVLNSQQIYGNELAAFTQEDSHKVIEVEKAPSEIMGLVLVESGWGSLLPTVVVANMLSTGAAARSGLLNIGDQLIAVNGLSLVGLPLTTSQNFISNMAKGKRSVRLTVVPCAPVVEVQIRRPSTQFQLGFSVQNGIICSLLRGGIAERGGVRVGHRIIEINDQSVVAVRHEQIVSILASSVGEIHMKTMPTAMFRLLTGQESPTYI